MSEHDTIAGVLALLERGTPEQEILDVLHGAGMLGVDVPRVLRAVQAEAVRRGLTLPSKLRANTP